MIEQDNRVIQSFWQGTLTPMELLCMKSFLANGHEFHLYTYGDVTGIPEGVVVKDANEIIPESELKRFRFIQQASDFFRVTMLLKKGGWYVDMDVVCLRPFDFEQEYVFGTIEHGGGVTIQNNVMRVPSNSPLMRHWYDAIAKMASSSLAGLPFEAIGPSFISSAIPKFKLDGFVKPWNYFDPVGWKRIQDIVDPSKTWNLGSSYSVHLFHAAWNKAEIEGISKLNATTSGVYPATCLYEQLKRRYLSTPKVSIVMTTFNRPTQLGRTLESIVLQQYKDFEVIVIDDGNDAETPEICSRHWPFVLKYFRLNRKHVGARSGPAVALNFGVRQASGEIVVMQNAECRHVGETIAQLLGALTPQNVVLCQADHLDQSGRNLGIVVNIKEAQFAYFFCGAIYKSWIEKLRGFDEEFDGIWGGEDDDFSARLAHAGLKFVFLDTRVQHQWHPGCLAMSADNRSATAAHVADGMVYQKKNDLQMGKIGIVRNLGRDWGHIKDSGLLKAVIGPPPSGPRPSEEKRIRGNARYAKDGLTLDWFDMHPV